MRYIANVQGGNEAFRPDRRPPLDKLPADVADRCREIDQLSSELNAARKLESDMKDPSLDEAARVADQHAQLTAARSGDDMPGDVHKEQLAARRVDAKRRVAALAGALEAATNDAHTARWAHDNNEGRLAVAAAHAKARDRILVAAAKLADAVDAAIAERAVADWYASGSYQAKAMTWPSDAIPSLANSGVSRVTAGPVAVRDILVGAITAVMEEPTP